MDFVSYQQHLTILGPSYDKGSDTRPPDQYMNAFSVIKQSNATFSQLIA